MRGKRKKKKKKTVKYITKNKNVLIIKISGKQILQDLNMVYERRPRKCENLKYG